MRDLDELLVRDNFRKLTREQIEAATAEGNQSLGHQPRRGLWRSTSSRFTFAAKFRIRSLQMGTSPG